MAVIVDCPTCGAKVEWNEINKFRPFCSNRCKQIDLGAWAEEKYVVPAVTPPGELGEHGDDKPGY